MALNRSPEFCLKLTFRHLLKAGYVPGDIWGSTGPLIKLFHYTIIQKFFHFFKCIYGLCFTIQVIKFSCYFVSINHINV